ARAARAGLALGALTSARWNRHGAWWARRSRRLTRNRLRGRFRDRQERKVSVAVLHDLVHRRQNERLADERRGLLGMCLVGITEDLVELRADELLPLDQRVRDRVNRVLLLLDETLRLFVELLEHLV